MSSIATSGTWSCYGVQPGEKPAQVGLGPDRPVARGARPRGADALRIEKGGIDLGRH